MTSYRPGKEGVIDPRKELLFSLSRDPQELHNLAAENSAERDRCQDELAAELRAASRYAMRQSPATLSPDALRRLKSLGYIE